MGIFLPSKRATNRRFDYEPRFYDPTKDQKLKQRMRIKSKVRRGRKSSSFMSLGILLILAIYIYFRMN